MNNNKFYLSHMGSNFKLGISLLIFVSILGCIIIYFNPISALIFTIVLIALLFFLLKPEIAIWFVVFVIYSNLSVVLIKFHNVPTILATSFFLVLSLPLIRYIFIQKNSIYVNNAFIIMILYLGLLIISTFFSEFMEESVSKITTFVLEGIVLYFLIINTVRTRKVLRKAVWALLFAGVLMGSISIYQEITKNYDNSFGGLAVVKKSVISTGQVDDQGKRVKRLRLSGPIGSKNRYAQIMVVLLPLALFTYWSESKKILKLLALVSTIPILGGALLTFSRGAGVAIIFVLLIMTFLRYIKIRHLLIFLAFCVILVMTVIPDYVYRSFNAFTSLSDVAEGKVEDADASVRGRATVNLTALLIFLDHPILGVGPGQTHLYMPKYSEGVGYRKILTTRRAHNMYLEELADTGILGFGTFMFIVILTLYRLSRLRKIFLKNNKINSNIAAGFFFAIVMYMTTALFLHLSYIRFFWLIMALGGAAIHILETEYHDEPGEKKETLKSKNKLHLAVPAE